MSPKEAESIAKMLVVDGLCRISERKPMELTLREQHGITEDADFDSIVLEARRIIDNFLGVLSKEH